MFDISHFVAPLILLRSIGVGYFLGIFYLLVIKAREMLQKNEIIKVLAEILYFILFGIVSFLFILDIDYGRVRVYVLLGEACGFFLSEPLRTFLKIKMIDRSAKRKKARQPKKNGNARKPENGKNKNKKQQKHKSKKNKKNQKKLLPTDIE